RRTLRGTELLAYSLERRRVSVVPVDVAQEAAERIEPTGIESAMLLDAVARAGAKLVQAPSCLGDADDRHVEVTALRHRLQGGKDLLVGEIARGAEEHEGIRLDVAHRASPSRRRLFEMAADLVAPLADVGRPQDAEPLCVGGHDPVLNSVVDHLHEVAAAVRPAVEIPALGGAVYGLPPRSAGDTARAGSERGKDRIEALHHGVLAADHQAISA